MTRRKQHLKKATNVRINQDFLNARINAAKVKGYGKAKWIEFCETMLDHGCEVSLYEARRTFSKYVTVRKDGAAFKVRFSNHRPIRRREIEGDCDFFVGVTNLGVTTTDQAIEATCDALSVGAAA